MHMHDLLHERAAELSRLASTVRTNLDKAEEEKFYDLLQRLGKFVFLNRILLKPHFQDKVTLF